VIVCLIQNLNDLIMLQKIILVTTFFLSCLLRSYCLAQTWIASFSTEWRLGLEEVEPQFFRWPMLLITDQQGYVYIHSYGDSYLRVFDTQGRFVKYIGRKGQGPGEFEAISQFFVDLENRLYVSDPINGRITIYDQDRENFSTISYQIYIYRALPIHKDSLLLVARVIGKKNDCMILITDTEFNNDHNACVAHASLFWSPEDPLYAMHVRRGDIRVAYRQGVLMVAPWLYQGRIFRLERHHSRWQAIPLSGRPIKYPAYTKLPDSTAPWDLAPSEKNNVFFASGSYGRIALRIHRRSLGIFALSNGRWGHFSVEQQQDPPLGFLELWDERGQYLGHAEIFSPPYEILWKDPERDTFYLLRWQEELPVIEKAQLELRRAR